MKLINLNSKKGVVNLFADYILKRFDKQSETIIQVTDFNHFFIVNGITNTTTVLDLSVVKDEFISEYQDLLKEVGYEENLSIMDLIKYDDKIEKETSVECEFYDSERNIYHPILTNYKFSENFIYSVNYDYDFTYETKRGYKSLVRGFYQSPLQITSEFPHGYSYSMGRTLLYYSEYIAHNILSSVICNKLSILLTTNIDNNNEQDIMIDCYKSFLSNQQIKSMVLDNFDFNFELFNKNIENYDICDDIKKPTKSKPWLVKDVNPVDLTIF
jgi:hypothetical protein